MCAYSIYLGALAIAIQGNEKKAERKIGRNNVKHWMTDTKRERINFISFFREAQQRRTCTGASYKQAYEITSVPQNTQRHSVSVRKAKSKNCIPAQPHNTVARRRLLCTNKYAAGRTLNCGAHMILRKVPTKQFHPIFKTAPLFSPDTVEGRTAGE